MEIIRCDKGHFYDADQCSTCPVCASEGQGAAPSPMGDLMATDMFMDNNAFGGMDSLSPTTPVSATVPVSPASPMMPAATVPANPGMSPISATVPVTAPATVPTPVPAPMPNPVTVPNPVPAPKVESYGSTQPAAYLVQDGNHPATHVGVDALNPTQPVSSKVGSSNPLVNDNGMFNPVVGWLVCVDGESKGMDYRIRSQYNYIGRAQHMDICIPSDPYISAERAAILAYDNQEKIFFFGPGTGHNLVRVNGEMVMNAVRLNPYDRLTIGKTKLLFVPLCGDNFDWNEK